MAGNELGFARISMIARSISSNTRLDTLVRDHRLPVSQFSLATHGGSIHGVKSGHYAAQQTAAYSITSSARNKSDVGMDMPRACAVRMLSTVSNFVGRSIGSAAGSAPRATLPARTPTSRYKLSRFGP